MCGGIEVHLRNVVWISSPECANGICANDSIFIDTGDSCRRVASANVVFLDGLVYENINM